MIKHQTSRRIFLKETVAGSLAAVTLSSLTEYPNDLEKAGKSLPSGAVILFQGDSITDGNRGRNADPNHIMGHGYAFSIASRLGYAFPEKQLAFYNRGVSGNTILDLANRWQEDVLNINPDILSILVGINDTHSMFGGDVAEKQVTMELYRKKYGELLKRTLAQKPNTLLVLLQPFIFKNVSTNKNWELRLADLQERQRVTAQLATEYNAIYIKLQDAFEEACKRAPENYWVWDGIHPTVAGHEIIAREWLRQVGRQCNFKSVKY